MKDVDRRDAEGLAANLHSCVSPALNHIILLLAALLQNSASSAPAACNLRKSSTATPPGGWIGGTTTLRGSCGTHIWLPTGPAVPDP